MSAIQIRDEFVDKTLYASLIKSKQSQSFASSNQIPYGGLVLKKPENELIDFNQYQRVIKKGESEHTATKGKLLWPSASKNIFGLLKWRKSLEEHELELLKKKFEEAKQLPDFEEEKDKDDWSEYERFARKMDGVQLRDLNVKNLRHIEQIKGRWSQQRQARLEFIDLNPFTPFKYQKELASHSHSPVERLNRKVSPTKKKGGTTAAKTSIKAAGNSRAAKRSKLQLEQMQRNSFHLTKGPADRGAKNVAPACKASK